jgi:hypothetical protein
MRYSFRKIGIFIDEKNYGEKYASAQFYTSWKFPEWARPSFEDKINDSKDMLPYYSAL